MGLCPEYDDPASNIRCSVRQTLALAFPPVGEVIDAFEELVENALAELQEFSVCGRSLYWKVGK